jgi:hypothetical protein
VIGVHAIGTKEEEEEGEKLWGKIRSSLWFERWRSIMVWMERERERDVKLEWGTPSYRSR